jgi:hypothetical protein
MRNPDEQERRDKLIELLFELSKAQDIFREKKKRSDIFLKLEEIYYIPGSDEYFRHFYSDILSTLTQIDSDDNEGSLDVLAVNMQAIKDGYQAVNYDGDELIDISKSIIKLFDHTNLEVARINYTKQLNNATKSDLASTKELLKKQREEFDNTKSETETIRNTLREETEKANKKIEDNQKQMQNEYVTILGIFAAIVLAFTGGMTFSSSVLNNISKASVYRLSLISFIIGLVFFNLIWVLIDFVRDINGKTIRKKWLFVVVNIIMVGGIICSCLAYKYKWF